MLLSHHPPKPKGYCDANLDHAFPDGDGSHHPPKPKGYCDCLARVVSRSINSQSHHPPKPKGYCDSRWPRPLWTPTPCRTIPQSRKAIATLRQALRPGRHRAVAPSPKAERLLRQALELVLDCFYRCVAPSPKAERLLRPEIGQGKVSVATGVAPSPKAERLLRAVWLGPTGPARPTGSAPYGATERTRAVGGVVWAMGGPWRVGWAVAPDGAGPVVPVGPVGPGCRGRCGWARGGVLIFLRKGGCFWGCDLVSFDGFRLRGFLSLWGRFPRSDTAVYCRAGARP